MPAENCRNSPKPRIRDNDLRCDNLSGNRTRLHSQEAKTLLFHSSSARFNSGWSHFNYGMVKFMWEGTKLKKNIWGLVELLVVSAFLLTACSEASRVESNLTKEADNFNVVRQLTVINCLQGDVLFQMTGKMSINADVNDNQLEIIVENDDGNYTKHFVGLSDNVTYTIEDLNLGSNDVQKYKYTLNFNPKMWFPVEIETID